MKGRGLASVANYRKLWRNETNDKYKSKRNNWLLIKHHDDYEKEGDADKLELELLHDLYHGDYETKQIIFLRDLYELLEKVIDRCRDAGNIILQIVLKYS